MQKSTKSKIERVGVFLLPQTRHRLNMFKASLSYEAGRFTPYDKAIDILLDHYDETTQTQDEKVNS